MPLKKESFPKNHERELWGLREKIPGAVIYAWQYSFTYYKSVALLTKKT